MTMMNDTLSSSYQPSIILGNGDLAIGLLISGQNKKLSPSLVIDCLQKGSDIICQKLFCISKLQIYNWFNDYIPNNE